MATDNQHQQAILDQEHLRLLAIFHYIRAGIIAFIACFPIVYVIIGVGMIIVSQHVPAKPGEPPIAVMGWIFAGIGMTIVVLGWLFAVLQFLVGRFISRKQHRTFCLVMAGINCLSIPYGTLAGVLTFIVLGRDTVRELFVSGKSPVMPAGSAPGASSAKI